MWSVLKCNLGIDMKQGRYLYSASCVITREGGNEDRIFTIDNWRTVSLVALFNYFNFLDSSGTSDL
jgi:hypothetical protein